MTDTENLFKYAASIAYFCTCEYDLLNMTYSVQLVTYWTKQSLAWKERNKMGGMGFYQPNHTRHMCVLVPTQDLYFYVQ